MGKQLAVYVQRLKKERKTGSTRTLSSLLCVTMWDIGALTCWSFVQTYLIKLFCLKRDFRTPSGFQSVHTELVRLHCTHTCQDMLNFHLIALWESPCWCRNTKWCHLLHFSLLKKWEQAVCFCSWPLVTKCLFFVKLLVGLELYAFVMPKS